MVRDKSREKIFSLENLKEISGRTLHLWTNISVKKWNWALNVDIVVERVGVLNQWNTTPSYVSNEDTATLSDLLNFILSTCHLIWLCNISKLRFKYLSTTCSLGRIQVETISSINYILINGHEIILDLYFCFCFCWSFPSNGRKFLCGLAGERQEKWKIHGRYILILKRWYRIGYILLRIFYL